jgi:predicted DNA-binding protein (UPF0251 family)
MNAMNCLRVVLSVLAAAVLAGCATPKPVLDLASQGMVVAGQTESEVQAFVASSDRTYEQRLASVRRLAFDDIEAGTMIEFEEFTANKAGMRAEVDRMQLIRELADTRAKLREKALADRADVEKTLANAGESPKVPKEKLAELRNALAQLSEELTTEEWLKFAYGYGQQVHATYKKLKADAAKAEAEAKAKGGK